MSTKRIAISGLTKYYGDNLVLDRIDLEVDVHEVVCLIGASGSGKSTLLRCINRLVEYDAGTILLDGVDIETEVRPDLMTNVVNGFGYLGAVSTHTQSAESLQRHLAGLQQTCAYCADNPQDFSCRF